MEIGFATYRAVNANGFVSEAVSKHTLNFVSLVDKTVSSITATPVELAAGLYAVALTSAQKAALPGQVYGTSSTSGVFIRGDVIPSAISIQDVRDAMMLAPTAGTAATGSVDSQLAAIKVKTDNITAESVSTSSWVNEAGDYEIYRGASYTDANDNAITATRTDTWPILTGVGTTVELRFLPIAAGQSGLVNSLSSAIEVCPDLTVPGEVTGDRDVMFELSEVETLELTAGIDNYQAQAWAYVNGNYVCLTYWTVSVKNGRQDCEETT